MRYLHTFLFFSFVIIGCRPSNAPIQISYQIAKLDGKARLVGRVTDLKTNEVLWSAVVSIEGTNLGADYNGNFYIDNIPLGKCIVKARVISNGVLVLQEIDVRPNQVVHVDFRIDIPDRDLKP